jgi:predicted peptidase
MKRILSTLVMLSVLASVISACAAAPKNSATTAPSTSATAVPTSTSQSAATNSGNSGGPTGGMMGGGGVDKSSDTVLQTMISQVEGKFKQFTYTDSTTGKTVPYNLYIPANYDSSKSYPLVLFIADSSVVGQDVTAPLTQGYGGIIWATDSDQAKHASFVLVPEFPDVVVDDHSGYVTTDYVEVTARLLKSVTGSYNIDTNRLYATGQSMDCMISLYLNATHPDLFAASLYVDGQWDVSILKPLEGQKFFYFAAGGDQKASTGMSEVKSMLDSAGVTYSATTVNAKAAADVIDAAVQKLISEGHKTNFVSWETGSVLPDGVTSQGANEHMYSFDHAYQVTAARDWLFAQVKAGN